MKRFASVLFILSFHLYADGALVTDFMWENKKGGLFDGVCIEYDRQTKGRMFRKRAAPENCKVADTQIAFHFPSGKCVEVDSDSGGKNYLAKIDIESCKTPNSIVKLQTFQDEPGCYEFDFPSKGKEYYRKLKMEECTKTVKSYFFKRTGERSGKCYAKDSGDKLIPVKLDFCKPENPVFVFKLKDRVSGYCFEQSPDGPDYYIDEVAKKHCRPDETDFAYIKKQGQKNGRCFIVDRKTGGQQYVELTSLKKCK